MIIFDSKLLTLNNVNLIQNIKSSIMQTLVHVYCQGNLTSLRKQISEDTKLNDYNLWVIENKNKSRASGWSKIRSDGDDGVLNLEWDAKTKLLLARAVNKMKTKPDMIIGNFISYLIGRHHKKIKLINILTVD